MHPMVDIYYGTEEVSDLIEDSFQINDDPQPQDKETIQMIDAPVPAPTRRSTRFKKPKRGRRIILK